MKLVSQASEILVSKSFYMAINIGAMFAPTAAIKMMEWAQTSLGMSEADSYHLAFAVACASLIFSMLVYYLFRGTFKHADRSKATAAASNSTVEELSPAATKERIVCLCLVFCRGYFLLDGIPSERFYFDLFCPRLYCNYFNRCCQHGF